MGFFEGIFHDAFRRGLCPLLRYVALMRNENGGWKWPLFAVAYTALAGCVLALLVYQGGKMLGLG